MRKPSAQKRLALEVALDSVKNHQDDLWEALSDLERLLGNRVELDANTDYQNYDVDTLLEMAAKPAREKLMQQYMVIWSITVESDSANGALESALDAMAEGNITPEVEEIEEVEGAQNPA